MSPLPQLRCLLVLFLLVVCSVAGVTAFMEAAPPTTRTEDVCAPNVYASECLAIEGCHWCCEAPFGSQCFSASSDAVRVGAGIVVTCTAEATLTSAPQTCEDLCRQTDTPCEACAAKSWCYFCHKSGRCQAPFDTCPDNSITRTCTDLAPDEASTPRWQVLGAVAVGVMAIAVVPALMYGGWRLGCRLRRAWRRCRRRRAARALRQPLLSPQANSAAGAATDPAPALPSAASAEPTVTTTAPVPAPVMSSRPSTVLDDDNVCYLCLAARPSVTFLPCYHTCCCEACSNRLRPVHGAITCPFCRRTVGAMVSLTRLLQHAEEGSRPVPTTTSA